MCQIVVPGTRDWGAVGVGLEGCGAEVCAMPGHKRFGDSSDFGIPRRGPDTCCRSCEVRLAADGSVLFECMHVYSNMHIY